MKCSFVPRSLANVFQTRNSSKLISDVDVLIFVVATRGLFSYDPAQSCKEIKDLAISNADGESRAPNEKIVQNHSNMALFNVFSI